MSVYNFGIMDKLSHSSLPPSKKLEQTQDKKTEQQSNERSAQVSSKDTGVEQCDNDIRICMRIPQSDLKGG